MKTFIVEDSPMICERLRSMIASIPNIELVGETDNEDDAVREICRVCPDLVILDLILAKGSGMEVLRRIREQPLTSKVIVLTNHGYPQYQKKCLELGADYFMDKSREIETLSDLLVSLAGGRHSHHEYRKIKRG